MSDAIDPVITLYLVRNREGRYFRRKGYGGAGESWTEDIAQARVYVGDRGVKQARAVVSFFVSCWPEYGVPDLVKFEARTVAVLDESGRVEKVMARKQKQEEEREVRERRSEYQRAQRDLKDAQERLDRVRGLSG